MRAFIASTIMLIASAAIAQEVQTVHIQNGSNQGSGVLCGGTANGSHRVILSVAHVTGTTPGSTMVAAINGKRYRAWLIGADQDSDSALLVVVGRHLENIPSARLWLGDIMTDQELRTEGFHGKQFVQTFGRPEYVLHRGKMLQWTSASYPGMSGGPTYLVSAKNPTFITTTTGSDYRTMSVGPYRTHFLRWIPTLETTNFEFTCSSSGTIQMRPRGIEGPITIPNAPPAATAQKQPDPAPEESLDALKAELGAELQKLLQERQAKPERPEPELKQATAKIQVVPSPKQETEVGPSESDIIVINVPVKLRVSVTDKVEVKVIE